MASIKLKMLGPSADTIVMERRKARYREEDIHDTHDHVIDLSAKPAIAPKDPPIRSAMEYGYNANAKDTLDP